MKADFFQKTMNALTARKDSILKESSEIDTKLEILRAAQGIVTGANAQLVPEFSTVQEPRDASKVESTVPERIHPNVLRGLGPMDALREIARRSADRVIRVKDIGQLLVSANVMHGSPADASSRVYSFVGQSRDFKRVGRGKYKLIRDRQQ